MSAISRTLKRMLGIQLSAQDVLDAERTYDNGVARAEAGLPWRSSRQLEDIQRAGEAARVHHLDDNKWFES